jgi:hypothetical protein
VACSNRKPNAAPIVKEIATRSASKKVRRMSSMIGYRGETLKGHTSDYLSSMGSSAVHRRSAASLDASGVGPRPRTSQCSSKIFVSYALPKQKLIPPRPVDTRSLNLGHHSLSLSPNGDANITPPSGKLPQAWARAHGKGGETRSGQSKASEDDASEQQKEPNKECLETVVAHHRNCHVRVADGNARIARNTERTNASWDGGVRFMT